MCHLNLSISFSCVDMNPVINHVLQKLASRGRPQHCGILLFLKYTGLVANSYTVATELKDD